MKQLKFNYKWLLWFGLGILLVSLAGYLELDELIYSILLWIDSLGTIGAIAFIIIYITATLLCVPGSILALGGGAVFGIVWGAILVFVGGVLGAVSAFWMGRFFIRSWVMQWLTKNRYLQAVDRAIATEGWKVACLLHLSPVIPFNLLNYVLGVSKIAFKDFTFATLVGILPGVLLYTFCGSVVGDFTMLAMGMSDDSHNEIQFFVSIFGVFITLLLTVYLSRIARRQLEETLD